MTQQEAVKSISDGLKGLQAATPRTAVAKGGDTEIGTKLLSAAIAIAERANAELANLPSGAQPAIGDGTFLAMLIQLLEMLLPLILKFFPVPG